MINRDTASAPYNFIPFNKNVVLHDKELVKHDSFLENENRISGKITYELTNMTEMFVGGNGEKRGEVQEFFGDDTHYIIPGSTIRGLIRSNVEILSLSEADMIEDRRMMHRSFADQCAPYRKEYSEKMRGNNERIRQSFNQSIKAGYLYWKNEHTLVIVPAEEFKGRNRNFLKVHESDVRGNRLLTEEKYYMYTKPIKKMRDCVDPNSVDKRKQEREYKSTIRRSAKKTYKPYGNRPYQSGAQVVQFQFDYGKITAFGSGGNKGYLFNSKWIDGKVNHYLVKALRQDQLKNSPQEKVVDEKLVVYYEEDLRRNAQQTNKLGELEYYYNLPYNRDGSRQIGPKYAKLFFYRSDKDGEVVDFGPTPYFRVFHNYNIKYGIRQQTIGKGKYDYTSSLFGFVKEDDKEQEAHYEGRLNFMNCLLPKTDDVVAKERAVVLMNPKPTAFQLYLVQKQTGDTNQLITYNDSQFELRGRKFYWKKKGVQTTAELKNMNTVSKIRPLMPLSSDKIKPKKYFRGEIYFENLTEAELGLLLCGMQYKSSDTDLLGHGKPYGYGRIKFENIKVLYDCKKESFYSLDSRYYDAFVFGDNSEGTYQSRQEFYDEALPEKLREAVYSNLREEEDTLVTDSDRLSDKIAFAINQLNIDGLFEKETVDENIKDYFIKIKELNEGYLSEFKKNVGNDLLQDYCSLLKENIRLEYSISLNDRMEYMANNTSNLLITKIREKKMNAKIEDLKNKFFEEIKAIEKNYDNLATIKVFRKVKEIESIENSTKENVDKFKYMELSKFKNRERLKSAEEILKL